jgi:uncharacterized protein (DUF2147 family)
MLKYCIIILLFIPQLVYSIEANDIVGKWYTKEDKSQIEIQKADNNSYKGEIVWLKEPLYPSSDIKAGQIKVDSNNPDLSLRDRPIMGLKLLKDFKFDRNAKKWINGKIYNPDDGKMYNCYMHFNEEGNLFVRGSIDAWGLIGQTQTWKRVE